MLRYVRASSAVLVSCLSGLYGYVYRVKDLIREISYDGRFL